ncbi:hypothetical protein [Rahnella woolbedingensis]|uniref:Uncharacterized protein n=1 Tax=Rahnella woolbedingensis TaxID=1510574 RepID=A0A419NAP5_9GAMM|nr:hypothetical protein [Rahnella woolbedingensis]RJT45019.1 hypothetical protein D6C13_07960 [Rahnella woolbedingensis]
MVKHERLIKFPMPDWNRVISSDLDSIAYCLCYQYDIDLNGNGPYGFNTNKASGIINDAFPNLFFYENNGKNNKVKLLSTQAIKSNGIYLYGNVDKINLLQQDLNYYYLSEKKNEMRLKRSLAPEPLPSEPLLLNLVRNREYRSDSIKRIIDSECGLFVYHHYMPAAGDCVILFDRHLVFSLKNIALNFDVEYFEVDSIDFLKAW